MIWHFLSVLSIIPAAFIWLVGFVLALISDGFDILSAGAYRSFHYFSVVGDGLWKKGEARG